MTITQEATNAINACKSCSETCMDCAKFCEGKDGMEACANLSRTSSTACDEHARMLTNGDNSAASKCVAACKATAGELEKWPNYEPCVKAAASCRKTIAACESAYATRA